MSGKVSMVPVRAPDRADSTTELLPHDFFRTRWYTNEGNCLYSSAILQCIKVNFSVVFVHFYEWTSNTEQKDSDVQYKCCVILNIVFLGGFTFKDCIPVFHFWAGCRVVWYVVWEWDAVCLGGKFLGWLYIQILHSSFEFLLLPNGLTGVGCVRMRCSFVSEGNEGRAYALPLTLDRLLLLLRFCKHFPYLCKSWCWWWKGWSWQKVCSCPQMYIKHCCCCCCYCSCGCCSNISNEFVVANFEN